MIGHQNALNIVGKDPCIGSHKSVLLSGQSSGTGDKKKEKKKRKEKKKAWNHEIRESTEPWMSNFIRLSLFLSLIIVHYYFEKRKLSKKFMNIRYY